MTNPGTESARGGADSVVAAYTDLPSFLFVESERLQAFAGIVRDT